MPDLKGALKSLALTVLPEGILQPLKKMHYARTLKSLSETDEPDFCVVKHLIHEGDCVIDVGANIGVYTKFLSELVGLRGCVHSIEPVPLTFDILKSNIEKLRLKNVQPRNCAISDRTGSLRMDVPSYNSGGNNYYQASVVNGEGGKSSRSFLVAAETLDSHFECLPGNITFIKCDVEGHELQCIKGAIKIIRKFRPAWLIEVSGNPTDLKDSASEVFSILSAEGYEGFWFDGTLLRKWQSGVKSVNYFFLTTEHEHILGSFFPVR